MRVNLEMAGRFMLEKLSHSSRSRNLLGAHFSSASDLLIRTTASDGGTTLGNHLRGLSAHPSTVVLSNHVIHGSSNHVIHGSDGGTTLGNHLRGLSAHPSTVLSNHVIHGSVARYYSTFSFSCPAAKTRSPTTGMSSIITHPMKPAFVDSVRGPKRTFSSKIIKHNIDWEAERAAMEAQLEANKKISRSANLEAQNADVRADFERCKAFLENLTDTSNAELAAWRDKMDNYKKKNVARFESVTYSSIFKLSDAWILCQALRCLAELGIRVGRVFGCVASCPRLHGPMLDAAKFDRLVNGILCVLAAVATYGIYLMHSGLECRRQSLIAARANVEDQNP